MTQRVSGRQEMGLRDLGLSVYVPTFLFAVGQGAVIPIVGLAAKDLGASIAIAGLVVTLRGIGVLAFDVPAGWLVSRFGERLAMAFGTLLVIGALAGSALSPHWAVLALCTFIMGCGWSVWLLARLAYVSDVMPAHLRGRALSTLGGMNRVGNFVGPFLFAGLAVFGGITVAYVIHIVTALCAWLLLLVLVKDADDSKGLPQHEHVNFAAVVREHSHVFLTAGIAATTIQTLRATRQLILPLWADHIGLDASAVGLVFGISMAMEMTLFYPAGSAMDRWGRKSVALPCLGIMSIGMLALPLTGGFLAITIVGLLIGFGNGLGSGIVMTLGADFSPDVGRAQFLGAWRVCGDIGTAGGPLVASAAIFAISLAGASLMMGAIGIVGLGIMVLRMPEPLHAARKAEQAKLSAEGAPAGGGS